MCACVYHNLTGTSCGGIAIIEHIAIDTSHQTGYKERDKGHPMMMVVELGRAKDTF